MPKKLTLAVIVLTPLIGLFAFRGTIVLLIVLALIGLWAERARCFDLSGSRIWLWPMGALLAWGAASAFWAYTPGLALPKAGSLALLVLAGVVSLGYARTVDEDFARKAMNALLAGMAAAAAIQLVEAQTGRHLFAFLHTLKTDVPGYLFPLPKPAGTLIAIWGVLCAPVCWVWGWRKRALLALAAAALMVWTTGSHAGGLALIGGLAGAAVGRAAPRLLRAALAAALVTAFIIGPLASRLPDTSVIIRHLDILPNSGLHRLAIWKFTADRILERPLLGWGMDGSRALPGGEDNVMVTLHYAPDMTRTEVLPQQQLPLHPHNFVLQVWVELGAVGAALFAAMGVAILWAGRGPGYRGAATLGTAAAAMIVASTGYGTWQAWWLAGLWFTAALGIMVLRVGTARDGGGP